MHVSILVSYWMGWELRDDNSVTSRSLGFNPSFLLDGLGIAYQRGATILHFRVSILVSYWMGWELFH